jgi:uncharacterized protein YjbI with pentapeptide repeats
MSVSAPGAPRSGYRSLERQSLITRLCHRRPRWPLVGVAVFVLVAGLSAIGVAFVQGISPQSGVIAVVVIAVGLLLWLPSGRHSGSRSELGTAVLGGAVVAFALLFFEGQRQESADHIAQRQNLQLALAAQPNLTGLHLPGRDLSGIVLVRKVLTGATLEGTILRGANLAAATLRGANLAAADLAEANLDGASLGRLLKLQTAQLAAYDPTNLRGADLSGADLVGADLSDAQLSGADLSGADLSGADLRGADLTDADLSGSRYSADTRWPDGFDPAAADATRV